MRRSSKESGAPFSFPSGWINAWGGHELPPVHASAQQPYTTPPQQTTGSTLPKSGNHPAQPLPTTTPTDTRQHPAKARITSTLHTGQKTQSRGHPPERGGRAEKNTANSAQHGAGLNKSGPHSNPELTSTRTDPLKCPMRLTTWDLYHVGA